MENYYQGRHFLKLDVNNQQPKGDKRSIEMTREEAINEIKKYISESGGEYPAWYVGITSDPNDRLFNAHKVVRNSFWIYCPCTDSEVARAVEEYFLGEEGSMGGPGGGDDNATYVYAYKIADGTVESA